jgi:class 3 adenylate cyclase
MKDVSVLLIDRDEHSGQALLADLQGRGYTRCEWTAPGMSVPAAVLRAPPDIVLFNHHVQRMDDLLSCCTAKLAAPHAFVVGIASTGPGIKSLREWNGEQGYLHAILEKPLRPDTLLTTLAALGERSVKERALREHAEVLSHLVPEGALHVLREGGEPKDEMFEAAIVFTDIRRSSEIITSQPPRDYFRALNASLSAQSTRIRADGGAIVKYTRDGIMALFRGMGRSHLAMRCALGLREPALQQPLPYGIGVAQGLVLAGLVGDSQAAGQRRQYDVIGATVHLAARLCGRAEAGQVVATRGVLDTSHLQAAHRALGPLKVRGFAAAIDCVAL